MLNDRHRRSRPVWAAAGLSLVLSIALVGGAGAAPPQVRPSAAPGSEVDVRKDYPVAGSGSTNKRSTTVRAAATAGITPPVGTVRQWLGADDYNGRLYRKDYTLRAVGTHAEVWVANDIAFPAGDCRGSASTVVTDAQVAGLLTQFDTVIQPRETAAFSTPPDRDGSNQQIGPDANGRGGDYSGVGSSTVILVDNVRDDNFYTFPAAPAYTAGFFRSQLNELFDRNTVTVDAYDWTHRTTSNPPDQPTADPCTSRPAMPNFYETTLTRSFAQLLLSYTDPNEVTWLAEGLTAYAESLTGYADPRKTVLEKRADPRIFCFQGFGTVKTAANPQPTDCGGPENSLTAWGDRGTGNPLRSDQGQVWSFLLYLKDRFGAAMIKDLHSDGAAQGLAGLQASLDRIAPGTRVADVLHDFQTMTLLDSVIDRSSAQVQGIAKARVVAASLNSTVNLTNPAAFVGDGAPANGADYVWVRNAQNKYVTGDALKSVTFAGDPTLAPQPLQWTTVTTNSDRPGNPVLWSGNASSTDAFAVARVTVPAADPTLRFLASYGAELGYDYGYVVVSTDDGLTYTALAGDRTVDGPLGPALNGTTTGFEPHTFDLSAFAGRSVLLGFRYVSDGGVNEGGLYVDNVTLGATVINDGTSTAPFLSRTQARPTPATWHVRLVGVDAGPLRALVQTYPSRTFTLSKANLAALKSYPVVVAIVSQDQVDETQTQPAAYKLVVNGVTQPGGGPATG